MAGTMPELLPPAGRWKPTWKLGRELGGKMAAGQGYDGGATAGYIRAAP